MCGIFAYSGKREAVSVVLEGLERLEYRGYDSSGIATIHNSELVYCKEVGKVINLQKSMSEKDWKSHIAIAHTRWATHGVPTQINAHPQFDDCFRCAVVHNGIIENYCEIKQWLTERDVIFRSDTDSESIAQLIGFFYKGNFLEAMRQACGMLKGSFAFAVMHKDHPDELICIAKESPLVIGIGDSEVFVASDLKAFAKYTEQMFVLRFSEIAVIKSGKVFVYNEFFELMDKEIREIRTNDKDLCKGTFRHYMLKEIFEQPDVLEHILNKHVLKKGSEEPVLSHNFLCDVPLDKIKRIRIIACGSSYHAGLAASYFYEMLVKVTVLVETSSEFLYREPYVSEEDFVILISQSGETADTLAVLRYLRKLNVFYILGLCNVETSSLAMEVDSCLFLEAGPEIGVASTKAFTAQVLLLILFGLKLAVIKEILNSDELTEWLIDLLRLPEQCHAIVTDHRLELVAKKYVLYDHFFLLGRRLMYPVALESALKLKEIAYVNANAYPAGEMKHGPIALISKGTPVFAFCGDSKVREKTVSNLMETGSRGAKIVLFSSQKDSHSCAEDAICIPENRSVCNVILYSVVGQLLAYNIALDRGTDIDCPRNLAKSVTVE
ncbi:MAG: glutamine--fructose-6-phosphate transaminase (isomerizing) [Victivallaceae bacterium]